MREIALDTQAATTVAIVDNGSVIARAHNDSGHHHAESITPLVREALSAAGLPAELADAGIDRILVGTGPAPFTGLRAGLVSARVLAANSTGGPLWPPDPTTSPSRDASRWGACPRC